MTKGPVTTARVVTQDFFTLDMAPHILQRMGDNPMPFSRVLLRVVAALVVCGLGAVSAAATTPANSTTPIKKHPHRRPYVRPGEKAPAVPGELGAAGGHGVEVINGTNSRTEYFPAEIKDNASQTRVEVINGSVRHTQVFETEQADTQTKSAGKRASKNAGTAASSAYSVKVINGNQWETRAFATAPEKTEATPVEQVRHEPVVVGISSSSTELAQTKTAPVVVGVASSESANGAGGAKPVVMQVTSNGSDGGHGVEKPVVTGVSPAQPKRQPYRGPGGQQ